MAQIVIITGGAGFIGTNLALDALKRGFEVVILDNLSRNGTYINLDLLSKNNNLKFYHCDIRDSITLSSIIKKYKDRIHAIFHLAAQVAVTTSVVNPRYDFEVNALGTFNVLEAVREHCPKVPVLYSSTNKVYGGLESIETEENDTRYSFKNITGISETQPLDYHSPYGCSKGIADQYMIDYHRIYGLNTVVMRQSCIYGTHQMGLEDQGWIAWFLIATMLEKKITLTLKMKKESLLLLFYQQWHYLLLLFWNFPMNLELIISWLLMGETDFKPIT